MRCVIFRTGDKYPEKYERVLTAQIKEHGRENCFVLNDKNRFYNYPGWWGKMELFSPELEHLRPFLFFDLDTYILGDIRDMVSFIPDELWMLEDAYVKGEGQSAIMAIPKDTSAIWDKWISDPQGWMRFHGDQDFLRLFRPKFLQDKFEGLYSYKADNCHDAPKGRVVFFHGEPKPHNARGWVKEIWDAIR